MAETITIGGVAVSIDDGARISETINGRNTLDVGVTSAAGAYRPSQGAEFIWTKDGTRIFAGTIQTPSEAGVFGVPLADITTTISVADFSGLAERRYVKQSWAAGWVLSDVLTDLLAYLPGVTLDPALVDWPAVVSSTNPPALEYLDYRRLDEILNDLAALTGGRVWTITYGKVLRMVEIGAEAAPFDVDTSLDTHLAGDMEVSRTRDYYANRVILRAGTGTYDVVDERHTGDGATRDFELDLPVLELNPKRLRHVDPTYGIDALKNVGTYPDAVLMWNWDAATNQIRQRITDTPLSAAGYIEISYTAQMPLDVVAEDVAEQATHGIYEVVVERPECFSRPLAEAYATEELAARLEETVTVRYPTRTPGVHQGQTQHITNAKRNVDGDFLITEVEATHESGAAWLYGVTAKAGGAVVGSSYRDTWKRMTGTGGATTALAAGGSVVSGSAPMAVDLGGDGLQMVRSATPTWVAASAKRMYVDAADRASVDVTVVCRVRARDAGVSVQPRLYNVTEAAAAGTGAAVTDTAWQDQTFAATLAEGANWYELQLLPGTANKDVAGVGYAELQ